MHPDNAIEITASSARSSNNKRTYTVIEIATLLQISKSKAYELCQQGFFKTIKVGRSVRISKLSFDEWLDSQ
ncbi:MAG: helix-turn-helix domain-containing protein [Firmicutes bacterium]|nr:helix-turn-helix domain-containing protein [Bacillota bacterium]